MQRVWEVNRIFKCAYSTVMTLRLKTLVKMDVVVGTCPHTQWLRWDDPKFEASVDFKENAIKKQICCPFLDRGHVPDTGIYFVSSY